MANLFTVEGRTPLGPDDRYSLAWFEKGEPKEVDAGLLLKEQGWHLFALDLTTREAVFAKVATTEKIFEAPFLNYALFNCATALLSMSLLEFVVLSCSVAKPRTLVHILNIGRCGSTLAHHLFNKVDGVVCLSEPGTYFPMAMSREELEDSEAIELLRACTRFHFLTGAFSADHTLVIKHHSQSLFQARRIHRADPDAKYIFMHRDAESWANSFYRMAQGFGMPLIQDVERKKFSWMMMSAVTDPSHLDGLIDLEDEDVQFESISAAAWVLQMSEHARLQQEGLRMLKLDYDDMNRNRAQTVQEMFSYCGLSVDHLEEILSAYGRDSQEGTPVGRAKVASDFSEDNLRRFRSVLKLFKEIPSGIFAL
jgi:hypothetical protein